MVNKKEVLNFWIEGEDLTRIIRDVWNSNNIVGAVNICREGLSKNMKIEMIIDICIGKLKFTGNTKKGNFLSLEKDNFKTEFTIKKQIEILERDFIHFSSKNAAIKRKIKYFEDPCPETTLYKSRGPGKHGCRKSEYDKDKEIVEIAEKKLKDILANLDILYSLAEKTMADLPINEIGELFSDIELERLFKKRDIVYNNLDGITEKAYGIELNKSDDDIIKETLEKDSIILDKIEKQMEKEGLFKTREKEETKKTESKIVKLEPETEINENIHSGWLSPKGKFYKCGLWQHYALEYIMAKNGIIPNNLTNNGEYLEKEGWVMLSVGRFLYSYESKRRFPTKKQIDFMLDFFHYGKNYERINFNGHKYKTTKEFLDEIEKLKGEL